MHIPIQSTDQGFEHGERQKECGKDVRYRKRLELNRKGEQLGHCIAVRGAALSSACERSVLRLRGSLYGILVQPVIQEGVVL